MRNPSHGHLGRFPLVRKSVAIISVGTKGTIGVAQQGLQFVFFLQRQHRVVEYLLV